MEVCSNRTGEKAVEPLKLVHKIATQAPESYTHVNLGKEIPQTRVADPPRGQPTCLSSVTSGRPWPNIPSRWERSTKWQQILASPSADQAFTFVVSAWILIAAFLPLRFPIWVTHYMATLLIGQFPLIASTPLSSISVFYSYSIKM